MKPKNAQFQRQEGNAPKEQADIFLKGGTVLNVYSGELLKVNVALKGKRIWYVGPLSNMVGNDTRVLDLKNKVLVPGYIDPHSHPWMIYNPISFGEEACRLGTTTLFCDNLIFYLLMGVELFEEFINTLSNMPINFFWSCRSAPQTPMENEDEIFSLDIVERLLKNPAVQSLGEITRWPELIKQNQKIVKMKSIAKMCKKRIDGHTAGAKYDELNILSRVGVESCHESINHEEVLDKLRLGYYVMLRESSLRQDLSKLLKAIGGNRVLTDRMMLTTDGSAPEFFQQFGITDNLIKIAIREGIDPISAYRMSTINPAVYFGLDHEIGGIAPGRYADILVLNDPLHPTPELIIAQGQVVAQNGTLLESFPQVDWERFFPKTSFSKRTWSATSSLFQIPCANKTIKFPVIKLLTSVITRTEWHEFHVKDGLLDLRAKDGFCFSALLNRNGRWVTNGILCGFGDRIEGIASSFNTATEILVIGREPKAMSVAVNRVLEIGGGIVAVENGKISYELPLPLGGVMSDRPMRELAEKERELQTFLSGRGYPFRDPLFTLVFLPNDFLPDVRINYKGVVDIKNNTILWPRRDLV